MAVAEYEVGALDKRLELAVNEPIDAVITRLAIELAGGDTKRARKGFRSKAARRLLALGAETLAKQEAAARARAAIGKNKGGSDR